MRSVAAVFFALVLSGTSLARAESARSVALSFEGCAEADAKEIQRLVAIDFAIAPADVATASVQVECRGDIWRLSVVGSTLSRALDFASTAASARARQTAIVLGELATETAAEREAKPTVVQPATPAAPPADRPAPPPARERFRLVALGGGRTLLGGVPRLLGAALRLEDLVIPWSLDALGEQGAVTTSEGVVSMRSLSAGVSLSLQQSLGGAQVRAGVGVRGGVVSMQGEPNAVAVSGQKLTRGWAGPLLSSALALRLPARLVFELVVEGGYTMWPVYGLVDGRREAALRGVWLGAQAGVGVSL